MGGRKDGIWMRRVHVEGEWLDGKDVSFKANRTALGDAAGLLGKGAWS